MKFEFTTHSEKETFQLGSKIGKSLKKGVVIALKGNLAAGKTTLVKGIASSIGGVPPDEVNSPTFTYLNIYTGLLKLYHFDLYRLKSASEFLQMGFDEYFDDNGVCCIEWAERIPLLMPEKRIDISLQHRGDCRKITIESHHEEINF